MKVFCIILGLVAISAAVRGFLSISSISGDPSSSAYWIGGAGGDLSVVAVQLVLAFFLIRYGLKKKKSKAA